MSREEWNLLVELALAVHEVSSPDRQRRISRAMEACEATAHPRRGGRGEGDVTARDIAQEIYDRATRGDWPNITVDRIERALVEERLAGFHEALDAAAEECKRTEVTEE